MVEIISRGIHPNEKDYIGTCTNCNTKVRFKAKEAKGKNSNYVNTNFTIDCPVCNHLIYGSEEKPSYSIQMYDR